MYDTELLIISSLDAPSPSTFYFGWRVGAGEPHTSRGRSKLVDSPRALKAGLSWVRVYYAST